MSNLDTWKAKSRFDVVLPSGTTVTLRLPSLRDCIAIGNIPLSVLAKVDDGKVAELTPEELAQASAFDNAVIRLAVLAVEGEDVTLTEADVADIPELDRADILAYAVRDKTPGKASA